VKRVLGTITVFLALGAIVNLLVAWTCAVTVRSDSAHLQRAQSWGPVGDLYIVTWRSPSMQIWFSRRGSHVEELPAYRASHPPPEMLLPAWSPLLAPTDDFRTGRIASEERLVEARGWPFLATWCEIDGTGGLPLIVRGGIRTPWSWTGDSLAPAILPRVLPYRPIWTGFLVNSVLYAATLTILTALPRQVRRMIRLHRGRCPRCAYPIGASPVCTECGARLPAARVGGAAT
jgi:hypothetical protein